MAKQTIRDVSTGKIIGTLDFQPNGDIIVYDFFGKNLGKYSKSMDATLDFFGRIVFKGNMAASLITLYGNK